MKKCVLQTNNIQLSVFAQHYELYYNMLVSDRISKALNIHSKPTSVLFIMFAMASVELRFSLAFSSGSATRQSHLLYAFLPLPKSLQSPFFILNKEAKY